MLRSLVVLLALAAALCEPVVAKDVVELKRGQGMLALRIISNRPVSNYSARWGVLVVRNLKTGKKLRLVDRYSGRPHHTYFVESLPTGDYQAFALESHGDYQVTYRGTEAMVATTEFPSDLRFRIEAGRLTNLATLAFVRPYYPADTKLFMGIALPDADLPRRVAYLLPADKVAALIVEPLGWTTIPETMRAERLTTRIRQASMFLAGFARSSDGARWVGEHFGQVARRSRQGEWTWEDTGTVETIAGLAETPDGTLYAAAENATVLRRKDSGRWERIDVPYRGEIACLFESQPDGSLLMAWENRESIAVLRYSPGASSPWKLLRTIEFSPALVNTHIRRCVALPVASKLLLIQQSPPLTKGESAMYVLDRATDRWSDYPSFILRGATGALPDGSLFALTGPTTDQKFEVSQDLGKTWDVRASLSGCGVPVFRTSDAGFIMCTENQQTALWLGQDGGRKWERHADLAAGIASMVLLEDPDLLFVDGKGKLFGSRDQGKTLSLERDSTAPQWW